MSNASSIMESLLKLLHTEVERNWFVEKLKLIDGDGQKKHFYLSFAQTHRFIEDKTPEYTSSMLQILESTYPGFKASSWTLRQLCRVAFMLRLATESNKKILDPLFSTADMHELVSLYKGLFLLENASDFTPHVAEGIRTNMTTVFDAIALNNPFPATYLSDDAWNQMMLKAIFMERPIYQIYGIAKRNNKKLSEIAKDFAHERWAAGRTVTPELWRLTSSFTDDGIFNDLQKVIATDVPIAKKAAIRSITESSHNAAKEWLKLQNLQTPFETWYEIGKSIHQKQD